MSETTITGRAVLNKYGVLIVFAQGKGRVIGKLAKGLVDIQPNTLTDIVITITTK